MTFEIVKAGRAKKLREKFIERFIDTDCEYYKKYYTQDDVYARFLWDCRKKPAVGRFYEYTQEQSADFLKIRGCVYFFWDHWRTGTVFADEFPNAVIKAGGEELGRLAVDEWNAELEAEKHDCYIEHPQLPSDIYVFDDSFSWYVIFTHETDEYTSPDNVVRYCIVYSDN